MNWNKIEDQLPEPFVEVLVIIDGYRSPQWGNNYPLVAYMNSDKEFFEERHPTIAPLSGVIKWSYIDY
jgi:hypothetical protein